MVETCFSVLNIFVYTEHLKYMAAEQAVISADFSEFVHIWLNCATEELVPEFLYQNRITESVPFCFFSVCIFCRLLPGSGFSSKDFSSSFSPTTMYLPTLTCTVISMNISL